MVNLSCCYLLRSTKWLLQRRIGTYLMLKETKGLRFPMKLISKHTLAPWIHNVIFSDTFTALTHIDLVKENLYYWKFAGNQLLYSWLTWKTFDRRAWKLTFPLPKWRSKYGKNSKQMWPMKWFILLRKNEIRTWLKITLTNQFSKNCFRNHGHVKLLVFFFLRLSSNYSQKNQPNRTYISALSILLFNVDLPIPTSGLSLPEWHNREGRLVFVWPIEDTSTLFRTEIYLPLTSTWTRLN